MIYYNQKVSGRYEHDTGKGMGATRERDNADRLCRATLGEISPDYTIKAIDAAHVKNTMQEALEEALDRDVSLVFEDAAEFDYDIWDTDGLEEEDVEDALIKCEAILTEAWDIVEHGEGW